MKSLKQRVFKGAFWTLGGNATSQFLRLGGNLILTRLLFPEAFGLMALVAVFTIGIAMFSDIGINASIIQNKRTDRAFLNTAWTLQVIRGLIVWLLVCLIAWPAALFYNEPLLLELLIVSGLSSVILGFQPTKLVTANRKIDLKTLTITEVASSFIGLIVMTIGAWLTHSVWALVVGGLIQSSTKVFMSFIYIKGDNNSFHWDSSAFASIYKFGRWLMLSSILSFLAGNGGKLIIGRITDVAFLGVFSIAGTLLGAVYMFTQKLGAAVFFPAYSEVVRKTPERLYFVLRKSRFSQIVMMLPIVMIFIYFGSDIINTLYDSRYSEAGWMLEALSLGALLGVLRTSYSGVLLAMGKSGVASGLLAAQVAFKFSSMFIGYYIAGVEGMIYSIAASEVPLYIIDSYIYSKFSLWQPEIDLPFIIISSAAAIVFLI